MISSGTMSMNCRMRNIPSGMHSMGASRAMKLSIQFMEDSTIYCGTPMTLPVKRMALTMRKSMSFFPGIWCLVITKAAMTVNTMQPIVATALTNTLLNRYRDSGTHMLLSSLDKSLKFSSVGWMT